MTFVKTNDHRGSQENANPERSVFTRMRTFLSSLPDYGWNLDSVAHLVLFVPFAVATIVCLSALDWGSFTMA